MPPNEGEPTFQEILQFDPFSEDSSTGSDPVPAEGGGTPTPPPADPGEAQPVVEPQPEVTEPPVTPPAPPKQVSQADLEQLIARQTEAIRAAVQPQPAAPQPTPAAPRFNLGVPEALTNALRSEDPAQFQAGVGALINGISNHVWNAFTEHLDRNVLPNVPRMIEQYVSSARRQEAVAQDFYGKYPQLQIPEMAPMVQTIGAQIAQEWYQQGKSIEWSETLRDAIAERVFQRLPFLRTAVQQAPVNGARRQPYAAGSGARPAPETNTPEADMMAMIFGGR